MNANHSRGLAGIAEHLQTYGRNGDTVLVHMTKGEVQGLQALAVQHGGTLTINPHTGLVEASFLKKLLPTLAGIAGTFVGIPPWVTAAAVGGAMGVASGSLKKGLLAGLQAYGGASLASGLGAGATTGAASAGGAQAADFGVALGGPSAAQAAGAVANPLVTSAAAPIGAGIPFGQAGAAVAQRAAEAQNFFTPALGSAVPNAANAVVPAALPKATGLMSMLPQGVQDFGGRFAAAARTGLPEGMVSKFAPNVAGMGVMSTASELMKPKMPKAMAETKYNYEGPYTSPYREVSYPANSDLNDSSEHLYFRNTNPVPGYVPYSKAFPARQTIGIDPRVQEGFAEGGMHLENGAFVVDARTVSELGNGSSSAGQERLKRLGGQPIKGGGDGVSDSIRANIGGKQEARVARDEVKFSPQAVARIGGGSPKRGADRLYALMAKAEKARKSAKRGQDTGLAGLLGA